jgi:hypothetical protein
LEEFIDIDDPFMGSEAAHGSYNADPHYMPTIQL